jgi:hypothetical protein
MDSRLMYTVSSRGRPIGVTDLGFVRIGGPSRSGWFYPNAAGERLMPIFAAPLPAMRAYLHQDLREDGNPIVQPQLIGSTLFADLAESLQNVASLDLALHREDGSLVPTELIGIQDTEQLLALADEADEERDAEEDFDDDFDDAIDGELDPDESLLDGAIGQITAWIPEDDEPPKFPRYQIHVVLADASAIQ